MDDLTAVHMIGYHARDDEVRELKAENAKLKSRVAELEASLRSIDMSKYCSYENSGYGQYGIGVADGHRRCAKVAHAALAGKEMT